MRAWLSAWRAYRGASAALREEALLDLVVEAQHLLQKGGHLGQCKLDPSRLVRRAADGSQSVERQPRGRARRAPRPGCPSPPSPPPLPQPPRPCCLRASKRGERQRGASTAALHRERAEHGFVGRLVVRDDLSEALAAVVAAVAVEQHAQLRSLHVRRVRAPRRWQRLTRQRPLRNRPQVSPCARAAAPQPRRRTTKRTSLGKTERNRPPIACIEHASAAAATWALRQGRARHHEERSAYERVKREVVHLHKRLPARRVERAAVAAPARQRGRRLPRGGGGEADADEAQHGRRDGRDARHATHKRGALLRKTRERGASAPVQPAYRGAASAAARLGGRQHGGVGGGGDGGVRSKRRRAPCQVLRERHAVGPGLVRVTCRHLQIPLGRGHGGSDARAPRGAATPPAGSNKAWLAGVAGGGDGPRGAALAT